MEMDIFLTLLQKYNFPHQLESSLPDPGCHNWVSLNIPVITFPAATIPRGQLTWTLLLEASCFDTFITQTLSIHSLSQKNAVKE